MRTRNGDAADLVRDGGLTWTPFRWTGQVHYKTETYGERGRGLCPAVGHSGLIMMIIIYNNNIRLGASTKYIDSKVKIPLLINLHRNTLILHLIPSRMVKLRMSYNTYDLATTS